MRAIVFLLALSLSASATMRTNFPVIWNGGGGSGDTLYTSDGALIGDRTIDLSGHDMRVKESSTAPAKLLIEDSSGRGIAISSPNNGHYVANIGTYGTASALHIGTRDYPGVLKIFNVNKVAIAAETINLEDF